MRSRSIISRVTASRLPARAAAMATVIMTMTLTTASLTGCDLLPQSDSKTTAPAQTSAPPAQTTAPSTQVQWSFYVVRHAERADGGSEDPPLTAEGQQRAQRLADILAGAHGVAVYATQFQRTQSTARPTAQAWGVPVTTYDGQTDAATLVDSIEAATKRGTVLIVGHSDTVPDIVSNLCLCEVAPIDDSDFGNLYHVDVAADGSVLKAEQNSDY